MTATEKLIQAVLEHDEKATKGPAVTEVTIDGFWRIRYPKIPRGFNGDCYALKMLCDQSDAECFAHYRTAAPILAKLLKRAIEQRDSLFGLQPTTPLKEKFNAELDVLANAALVSEAEGK